jgi:hypothetical protein
MILAVLLAGAAAVFAMMALLIVALSFTGLLR